MKATTKLQLVLGVSVLAMTATLAFVAPAMAASDTATLQGHAAPGRTVTATDTVTGQTVTVTADASGNYVIVGLRPSSYHVTSGPANEDITLPIGETITLDLTGAPETTTVTVVGRRGKEVRTSEVATNVSQAQIENLPQNGRNFLNFAALAPGIVMSTDPQNKQFSAGGMSSNNVNVFIDGQSQKNQVIQGGVAGQDSSRGNPFPQLAIQEFKVSTQNFKAEYEQAGSAIISAVTKTGGNEFHGSAFVDYQSKDMIGQPFYQRNQPKGDYSNKEYGFDLGGPIVKDLLHFYVAYEGREDKRPSSSVLMPDAATLGGNTALASELAKENGIFPQNFKEDLAFGKLTWTPDDANTIELSLTNRTEDDEQGFGGTTAHSHGSTLDQYVKEGVLSWKYRGDNLLNEASLEYQSYHWRQAPLSTSPGINLINNTTNYNTLALIGGPTYQQEKAQENITVKDNVTLTGFDWHGQHVIKTGVKLASYKYIAVEDDHYSNPEYYYVASTYVPGSTSNVPTRVRIADSNPYQSNTNTQVGLFIQDDWTVDEHLTLNLGIRWDYETNMLNNDYVTPADIATAIRNYPNMVAGGLNPEDYISNGHNRHAFGGAFQPRLGFSYDINGDRQTVIFGGFGRYYDRTIYDDAQLEYRRANNHVTDINFDNTNNDPADDWNPAYFNDKSALVANAKARNLKGEVIVLNNNLKIPHSDQFDIGVRHQFGSIATSVTFSDIQSRDNFSFVLGQRAPDGSWSDGGSCNYGPEYACQPWGFHIPGGYGNFIISTNDQRSHYQGLYFTVDKPYTKASHYGYSGTLTLTNAKATGHNDRFIFDYAMPHDSGWHAAEGTDKVRFVGTGIVDGPWDTRISTFITLASGAPFDYIDTTGPALRIIPGGIFPKNKLAYKDVDLRISKDFTLPNGNVITIDGQVYNVFDWVNKTYSGWGGGFNGGGGASGAGDNNTTGYARSFQVGLRYKF